MVDAMKKKPHTHLDVNELAASIVKGATEEKTPEDQPENPANTKNPNAVALGRLGGLKGGPARASKLSKKKRSEIAKKAAQKRWNKE